MHETTDLPLPHSPALTVSDRMRSRFKAAGLHLLLSVLVAGIVLSLVCFAWYPAPLARISGVGDILVMLLAIDVTLGPILTGVVFDRRKKSLPFDLAVIAAMQLAALAYGVHTVEAGRPHFLVFVVDRFEVVSHVDLQADDRAAAADNPAATTHWASPAIVGVLPPTDPKVREAIMLESVQGGRDLQHFPALYRDLRSLADAVKSRAVGLSDLRTLNPERGDVLDAAIRKAGVPATRLGYLPIKGSAGDAAMLIDTETGETRGMVDLVPWR